METGLLTPYAKNARTHSREQVGQIAASIREFGWMNPVIVDASDNIIAGHGRVLAAKRLGLRTVPVIRVTHLTATQRRAYVLADNRLAEAAGWDDELLRVEVQELTDAGFNVELAGFDAEEIEAILAGEDPPAPKTRRQNAADSARVVTCPKCSHEFRAAKS